MQTEKGCCPQVARIKHALIRGPPFRVTFCPLFPKGEKADSCKTVRDFVEIVGLPRETVGF